jgi:hypothetical protein
MKHEQLKFNKGFRVSVGNAKSQGAVMVLSPGDTEGGPDNRHRGADQWLYVQEGTGTANINGASRRSNSVRSSSSRPATPTRSATRGGAPQDGERVPAAGL